MRARLTRASRRPRRRTPPGVLLRRFGAVAALLCATLLVVQPTSDPLAAADQASSPATSTTSSLPPGYVQVPVRLTDPSVGALLSRGDVVDLYAGEAGSPLTLVRAGLLVVRVEVPSAGTLTPGAGALVVLAAGPDDAADIVSVSGAGVIVVTLHGLNSGGDPQTASVP